MLPKKVIRTSALTLACALSIGAYMQFSVQAPEVGQQERDTTLPVISATVELPGEPGPTRLEIENITLTSAPAEPTAESWTTEEEPAARCAMVADAVAAPMAMVELTVSAPCQAGERVTIHHSGISFSARLDETGRFQSSVPALAETAVFIAEAGSGLGAVAVAQVDDLDRVDRVVLQWIGNSGFEIHAREFGAAYGSAGHLWHGAEPGAALGHLMRLGDDSLLAPRIAEIYSLPRAASDRAGTVTMTAEAEVTGINCGRDIAAQALQLRDGQLSSRDLVMAMPDCSAEGSFLVLNNLVEDLKIASN
ncbi:hypothetical protein KUV61_07370 [Nocardioides marinus]|nr:hypothetical protein [Nocardioides marinus]